MPVLTRNNMSKKSTNNPFGSKITQIMDPVHGGIEILEHEAFCIDHPLFQRLRYILQNDVANYVFPGATHTRFNHSLGTMHLAGKLFRSLVDQYIGEASDGFTLSEKHREAIYYVYACFRLAALLHDTGHFPFSHEFEKSDSIKTLLHDKNILKDFWQKSELYEKYAKNSLSNNNFELSHEDYSLAVAYKILSAAKSENKLPVEIDDVLALMESFSGTNSAEWKNATLNLLEVFEGNDQSSSTYDKDFVSNSIKNYFSMMISGEIDVDKMDYLLRDSYFSGAKYGIYNADHLISTLRIGFDKTTNWVGLAILEKGVVALEDFVYSRFQIYQNMWSHKAVIRSKLLLSDAISEVATSTDNIKTIRSYMTDEKKFSVFTDHFFLEKFRDIHINNNNSASSKFLFRTKMEHLDRLTDPSSNKIASVHEELKNKHQKRIIYRATPIKFSEIPLRDFANIRVISNEKSNKRILVELKEKTDFFQKFGGKLIVNFYAQ